MNNHTPDVVNLAISLQEQLALYLPLLMNGAFTQIGKSGVEITVKEIWKKIEPVLKATDDARIAAEQLVAKPESEPRRAVFQEELETLLKENPDVAREIAQILAGSNIGTQINQIATGNGAQTIGQVLGGKVFGNVDGNLTIHE
jgi:hypothetical protein